jgi:hypothetical protein
MTITPDFLNTVCAALANGNALRPEVAAELREAFPGTPFTLCDDGDIPSRLKPLAEGEGFALYGVNTCGHCATLTSDIDAADGLTIGLRDDDE